MDITFSCTKCGQHLVVDEQAAGQSLDCPNCGNPVYVPSSTPTPITDTPVRVQVKSVSRIAIPSTPVTPAYSSEAPTSTFQETAGIHPSIEGGIQCLVILVAILLIGFFVIQANILWMSVFMAMPIPFGGAALLCGVYGICHGHIKQGILIIAGLSLIIGLAYWGMMMAASQGAINASSEMQRQMEQFMPGKH